MEEEIERKGLSTGRFCHKINNEKIEWFYREFNTKEIEDIIKHFNPKFILEIGTDHGLLTEWFSTKVYQVHIIEYNKEVWEKTKLKFSKTENIQCHLGSSDDPYEIIRIILPIIKKERVLLYIDTRRNNQLIQEVVEIVNCVNEKATIIIDDIFHPNFYCFYDQNPIAQFIYVNGERLIYYSSNLS